MQAKCLTWKKLDVANNTFNGPLDSVAAGSVNVITRNPNFLAVNT